MCFGLLRAIFRGSEYFNIDYTSVLKRWYIHLRVKQNKTLVPNLNRICLCVVLGFGRGVYNIYALLGRYVA
jgi:hypothetical protein